MDRFHGRDHKLRGRISGNLRQNIEYIEEVMRDCNDLIKKEFQTGREKNTKIYILYIDGLVNVDMIQESIVKPLLLEGGGYEKDVLDQRIIESADRKWISKMEEAVTGVLSGCTVLFIDGISQAVLISTKFFPGIFLLEKCPGYPFALAVVQAFVPVKAIPSINCLWKIM